MKLYFSPASCSLASHIVLHELGVAFETDRVDLKTKKTFSGEDFWKINPKGYVPCLQLDSGEILTEGVVILQYLADLDSAKKLAPPVGSMERYRIQELLNFIATEVHKNFSPLWNKEAPDVIKQMAIERLGNRLNYLNTTMAGKDFAFGSSFSIADAYLFTVLNWAGYVKLEMTAWPHLIKYCERIKSLPSVQSAMKAEGILK